MQQSKEVQFKCQGYTLKVQHQQPENFGPYAEGTWEYNLVMDVTKESVLSGKGFSVNNVCADFQSYLLRCQYRPDPFYVFITAEEVRNTLGHNLNMALNEKVMESLRQIAKPLPLTAIAPF